ncbi:hypothetical protein [Paenibacillus aceris]|uniref:Membrane-anchored protein n=1 Tax=Paenibacillus aceris TaxID=869555 RepID=A0ABS4I0D9_9BACL|nr:hypothetical protein [Paenibacillus aceris]MBP1964268.1 putative membrane-anchored protein [Paenibacillus aceris]NHW36590.1 hypothetical protein [Paenibacillus aceris]
MESLRSNETKTMLSKVPEVTIYFWIIKILCTTVGETAADFLNVNLGFGLTGTSIVMGILLFVTLFFQFRAQKYMPSLYWLTVVLISIFGTLVTDNLTDNMGISLEVSTTVFSIVLILIFALWYAKEKTLSIHSIFTKRRETFYWLTILFTFALGTAAGDLMAESLGLGYLVTGSIVCAVIACVTAAWRLGLNAVLAFWIAYIMTRPLGASLGDLLSQPQEFGGLGLGATATSIIFLLAILLIIIFLSITKRDLVASSTKPTTNTKGIVIVWQVVIVVGVLMLAAGTGYYLRHTSLQETLQQGDSSIQAGSSGSGPQASQQVGSSGAVTQASPLGDLSSFKKIAEDTQNLVNAGNMSGAKSRVDDLEHSWDNAEARLKPMNKKKWTEVDDAIDKVLRQVRAVHQDAEACKAALESLIALTS